MKKQVLIGFLAVGLLICLTGAPAHAQDKVDVFAGYSVGTTNFGCISSSCYDPAIHGYAAAFAYNFNRHIGLEANFSGHNGTSTLDHEPATSTSDGYTDSVRQDAYFYTFGPRLTVPVGRFSIFGHFLVGAAHIHEGLQYMCLPSTGSESCGTPDNYHITGNGFAFKTGGGVDWNHGHWGIRILEVDFIRTEFQVTEIENCSECSTTPYTYPVPGSNFELSAGIKFNFGGKQ